MPNEISKIKLPNEQEARNIKDATARQVFAPATQSQGGVQGQVPAPLYSEVLAGEFLRADATWAKPSATVAVDNEGTITNTTVEEAVLVAGTNVTITPDTTNHTVTISSTGGSGGGSYTEGTGIDITDQDVINNTGILNVTSDNISSTAPAGTITITKLNSAGTATEETQVAVKGLGSAATKGVDTTITSASTASNVPTSDVVYSFVNTNYATKDTFTTLANGLVPAADGTDEDTMFLKGDATWATPDNTTYTVETGTANGKIKVTPSNDTAYEVPVYGLDNAAYKDVDTSITASSTSTKLPTSQAVASFVEGKGYTTNTGTVTQIGATGGLKTNKTNNADITDNGTLELNLKDTAYSTAVGNKETTTQIYPVVLDSAGYPCVGVPWTDTTYTQASNSAITVNNTNHTIDVAIGAVGTKGVVELSTSIPAVSSAVDTKVATEKAVAKAIDDLPEPMIFKGSVGDSGTVTWTNLPSAASSNEGYTYKVITKHTTAPKCEVGDTIISNGSEWVVIPSGDEPKGDVTGIKLGTGGSTYSPGSDGIVELPAYPTSMSIDNISGIATNTSIKGVNAVNNRVDTLSTSAASSTAPTGNYINQFSYDSTTAKLTINYLTYTKAASVTTTQVNNVVTKTS